MPKALFSAAALAAFALAAPAHADRNTPQFTSLTVFGDSLVDAGNLHALNPAYASAAQGYYMGRFTNGYDYTDLLSQAVYGRVTTASLLGGTNFAYGGARASATSAVPDLSEQLGLFNAYLGQGHAIDPNGLYVLNFGGNDIFNAPGDPAAKAAFLQQSARDYVDGIQALLNAGVKNILFTGFPVLTDPASAQAEGYLTTELARLTVGAGVTLDRFSYLDFFTEVTTDPAALGLTPLRTDVTCQSQGAAVIQAGCPGIFSFDGTHPTEVVQQALFRDLDRQFALTASIPEPASWAMMVAGFAALGVTLRRRSAYAAT